VLGECDELFIHTAFAATLALSNAATAAEQGQVNRGHKVAEHTCAACHAVERNQARSPIRVAPPFEQVANAHAMTQLALRVALQSSHPIMPNVRLSEAERTDVIAYLMSLKRVSVGYVEPPNRAPTETTESSRRTPNHAAAAK